MGDIKTDTLQDVQVQNIVATSVVSDKLDLDLITKILPNVDYDAARFPGAIYRIEDPKVTLLIFSTGKVVCTGAKNIEMIEVALSGFVKLLSNKKIDVDEKPPITIRNIVATYDLKSNVELNKLSISFGLENVEYEPEQFPGVVYRLHRPKVVILIFGSGKLVCTGGKTVEDVVSAVEILKENLYSTGLIDRV